MFKLDEFINNLFLPKRFNGYGNVKLFALPTPNPNMSPIVVPYEPLPPNTSNPTTEIFPFNVLNENVSVLPFAIIAAFNAAIIVVAL